MMLAFRLQQPTRASWFILSVVYGNTPTSVVAG